MKGMSRYTPVERALSRLSNDELNELFLSGELDRIYEEFEKTGKVRIRRGKGKRKRRGEN
jgi:hypothetical protein